MLDLFAGDRGGRDVPQRRLRVAVTERRDGDLHPLRVPHDELTARQRTLTGTTWAMADQVHGTARWHVVDAAAASTRPPPAADVLVTDDPDVALAVWAADCATVLLGASNGRLVAAHAGWRGLAAGVLDRAIDAATCTDATIDCVVLGPVVEPCCYEFGDEDLAAVAAGVGTEPGRLRGVTRRGTPALDVRLAVSAGLGRRGLTPDAAAPGCTGCSGTWWSHRVGLDAARHALVGWWS